MEKNPFKIIINSRNSLLPVSVWIMYLVYVIILLIMTFVIPDKILKMNYSVLDTSSFVVISLSALAFILSMYMFGREVYTMEDFANLYLKNSIVYYSYLSDYLFPAFLWCLISFLSVCKLIIIVKVPGWFEDLLRVAFISIVSLALISTITLVIHNMNRVSNKVVIESKRIENGK